jgi:hypothetical protein
MPIQTVLDLSGQWESGGVPGPFITVGGNSLSVDMSVFNRPTASGSILDSSDITVTFPDDKTYTGKLQLPGTILWSNNSFWTEVPVPTTINLNGAWASGGVPGPFISVHNKSISVDMSAFNRPTATGTILDSSDITVTFPDDKTYTGKLQPPNTIHWSNNSAWTKVGVSMNTLFDLNGQWASGGVPGPVISVDGKTIAVDMSFFTRPAATGSILDFADIKVTFPDDKTYTGKLQLPGTIHWSNNTTWIKVGTKTLFSSNFSFIPDGAPPSNAQAVGTARVEGAPNGVLVDPPFKSPLKWVRIDGGVPLTSGQVPSFVGVLAEVDGTGRYNFSASLVVPTGSAVCSISFETAAAQEFMHIDFTTNNTVRIDDLVEFGSFKRDQAFVVQVSLNISGTQSTAHVAVSGGGAAGALDYNIQQAFNQFSPQFGAIRLWKGFGDPGVYYGTSIVVTRTA